MQNKIYAKGYLYIPYLKFNTMSEITKIPSNRKIVKLW